MLFKEFDAATTPIEGHMLLEASAGTELEAAKAVQPKGRALWLLGISLGATVAAAAVTFFIVRLLAKRKKRRARSASRHGK